MHIHFKPPTEVIDFTEEKISIKAADSSLELTQPNRAVSQVLRSLLSGGQKEKALIDVWTKESSDLPRFFYLLESLRKKALLSYTVYNGKSPLCTLTPHQGCDFKLQNSIETNTYQLSRFAYVRNRNGTFIWETPLAAAYLESQSPNLLFALAKPITLPELKKLFPKISMTALREFVTLLQRASFLETDNKALTTWDFHDLLFHSRSRRGRHGDVTATMFRFLDKIPPLPPLKPNEPKSLPLYKPDIETLMKEDAPFSYVVETRRSLRDQGEQPISLNELGEFLYRSARVKGSRAAQNYEATTRPYPGGGACYELEIYPLVNRCNGLDQGLYYYHPGEHTLTLISSWNTDLEQILDATSRSTGKKELPQIAFLIASRFARLSWKYQSMAYAITLKDTGVLMQTMYLIATAMGLAPCAVGAGDSDLFAKVAKKNYYEETTVGEFILGSRTHFKTGTLP